MRTGLLAAAVVLLAAHPAAADLPARLTSGELPWWHRPAVARLDSGPVVLPGDVLFDSGEHGLTPAARTLLGEVTARLAVVLGQRVLVTGHTDGVGDPGNNLALSRRRAAAVASHLVSAGVPAQSVTVIGAGEEQPVADDSTEQGRRANRRVEIVLQ